MRRASPKKMVWRAGSEGSFIASYFIAFKYLRAAKGRRLHWLAP